MEADTHEYDCSQCGLCCIGGLDLYQQDLDRWREHGLSHCEQVIAASSAEQPCPFLTPGQPFRCTIYPDRPRVCQDFPNGGNRCRYIREQHGLPL